MPITLMDQLFNVVAAFEGADAYENVTTNFDGQGVSLGFIQFPFGTGGAQMLLKAFAKKDPELFKRCCTTRVTYSTPKGKVDQVQDLSTALLAACNLPTAEGTKWIIERQYTKEVRGRKVWHLLPHWQTVFKALLKEPKFQDVQRDLAMPYWQDAVSDFKLFKGETVGHLLFLLDVAVQNGQGKLEYGSGKGFQKWLELGGSLKVAVSTRFKLLKQAVVSTCKTEFSVDVDKRKSACLNGTGVVHGLKVVDLFKKHGVDVNAKVTAADLAA